MSAKLLSAEQCAEIISLAGAVTAPQLATHYGVSISRIKGVWYEDRRARGVPRYQHGPRAASAGRPKRRVAETGRPARMSVRTGLSMLKGWATPVPCGRPVKDPLTAKGKTFADVGEHECMWCIGRDGDDVARFCAEPRQRPAAVGRLGVAYCAMHAARATRPPFTRPVPVSPSKPHIRLMYKLAGPGDAPLKELYEVA